jgi:glycosyltransferase involved in cell wall biosynthesis
MRLSGPVAPLRRVLLVADCVGGVWHYSLELARGLAAHDIQVVLAVAGPAPSPTQREEAETVPGLRLRVLEVGLDWLPDGEAHLAPMREGLVRLARAEHVDLIHLNGAALGDLPRERPVIATQHSCLATWWQAMRPQTPLPAQWQWHRARMAAGLRAADAVIVPSAAFAEQLRRAYGSDLVLEVIHNGRATRGFHRAPRRQAVVLTAGRLWDEAKNLGTLDAAAMDLPWPVLAAGPMRGPDDQAVALEHIFPLGSLGPRAMRRRFSQAGIFVSLAAYEPFGLAVLEAALCGCPLVLSDIPTFRELWDEAAVFCPPHDAAAAHAALGRLIADRDLRTRLAGEAHRRALGYSSAACAEATLAVYRRVVAAFVRRPRERTFRAAG